MNVRVLIDRSAVLFMALGSAACSVGPDYVKPAARVPVAFKELKGWRHATPKDAVDRGPWWEAYHDPTLTGLERQVNISNQTIKASEASYRQAVAVIKEAQAGLFPTVSAGYSGTLSHEGSAVSSSRGTTTATGTSTGSAGTTTATGGSGGTTETTFTASTSASWDLDVWGRIRRQIESDVAAAQVSEADLAEARLSAQAQLATAYFNLRAEDSLHKLLTDTAAAYQKTLEITQNQYAAGTAAKSDVDNALAQLKTVQAQAIATGVGRAQYEHAIALLVGKTPAELTIKTGALGDHPVAVPPRVPSALLERRPDIAAAERVMQQQNELIGVAAAAFYPDISLSGVLEGVGRSAFPLSAANEIWSLGGSASQILFDGGQRLAVVAASTAAYDQSVATYRQTVLTAFQQVEDGLASLRILAQQASVQDEAVKAARSAVEITLNEYRAGTVAFTSVVTAQATQLGDEQTALTVRQNRYLASVALIQALGGGWAANALPTSDALRDAPTPPTSSPNLSSDVFTPKVHL